MLRSCLQPRSTADTSLKFCFPCQLQTLIRLFKSKFLNKRAWGREGLHHFFTLEVIVFRCSFRVQMLMKIQLHPSYSSFLHFKEKTDDCAMVPFSYSPLISNKLQAPAFQVSAMAFELAPTATKAKACLRLFQALCKLRLMLVTVKVISTLTTRYTKLRCQLSCRNDPKFFTELLAADSLQGKDSCSMK